VKSKLCLFRSGGLELHFYKLVRLGYIFETQVRIEPFFHKFDEVRLVLLNW